MLHERGSWYYEVYYLGYKYNLTDIAAAIGIEQLSKCTEFWKARKRIAYVYDKCFADLSEIQIPSCQPNLEHAWHLYVIQLNLDHLKITRNQFIEALREKGIGTSVHFIPLHLHPYYCNKFGYKPEDFPNASAVYDQIVSLPIYPKMTEADVESVIGAVSKVVKQNRRR